MQAKVLLYDWGGANAALFHAINQVHSAVLDQVMLLGTALAAHTHFPYYLALLALVGVIATRRRGDASPNERARSAAQGAYLGTIAVFALGYLIDGWVVTSLKSWLDFPRPPAVFGADHMIVVGKAEFSRSFPSGHASFAALVVASVWPLLSGWQRAGGMLFVVWVMLSRISLGFHFPADVLAGAFLSIAVVLLVRRALGYLESTPAPPP